MYSCSIGELNMTDAQNTFAKVWMSLFDNDIEDMRHQLSIKRDFSIPNFSDDEAQEIWAFIEQMCDSL